MTDLSLVMLNRLSTNQAPATSHQLPGLSSAHTTQNSDMDLDTDSDAEPVDWPTNGFDEEGEFSDPDPDLTTTDIDHALLEE